MSELVKCIYLSIFSISWKLLPLSWIFFIDPGLIAFISLHSTTPSFKMSSNLQKWNKVTCFVDCYDIQFQSNYGLLGNLLSRTASIHWRSSASCSGFRWPTIYDNGKIVNVEYVLGIKKIEIWLKYSLHSIFFTKWILIMMLYSNFDFT